MHFNVAALQEHDQHQTMAEQHLKQHVERYGPDIADLTAGGL
jgi:hypothetical protein